MTLDAYCDVHQELRLIVDNYMRVELEMLRVALAIETKQKYVPPKPKKEKKKKKKKEKKIEDVTEGRTLEECYEELKKFNVSFSVLSNYSTEYTAIFVPIPFSNDLILSGDQKVRKKVTKELYR